MSEQNNEREFFTLVDEDGKEIEFEKIAEVEMKGNRYVAMIPAEGAVSEDGFCEYVILRVENEGGEVTFVSVDDPDEEDDVADLFDDMFSEEIDYDAK
ncbi:MAG: DUF1292 domain-containing protein [Clostridia bacterium]|nr:DUF1292 domain-containing protein [Clostridia bacterium]